MVLRSLAVTALVAMLALPAGALAQSTATPGTGAPTTTGEVAPIVPVPPGTAATTTPAPVAPAPAPATPPTTAPTTADQQLIGSSGTGGVGTIPNPQPWVVLVVVVAGLLLLLLLAIGLARWRAWDPPWLRRARHACAEASWRLGGTWSEFTDWVRLGR